MDIALLLKDRLNELGPRAARPGSCYQVTGSYISDKMAKLLKLPGADLVKLANHQRREQVMTKIGDRPGPLFLEVRELILAKCDPDKQTPLRAVFERQPLRARALRDPKTFGCGQGTRQAGN